jgi:hypothetical protein
VVNLGGDADTTGAVAGGLLGAHYGATAVPARWAGALAYGPEVMSLAPSLCELRVGATSRRGRESPRWLPTKPLMAGET